MAMTPSLRQHSLLGHSHHTPGRGCQSLGEACREPGHARMGSNLNRHQVFSKPDKISKPHCYEAKHLSWLEQNKTATSLIKMTVMASFDRNKRGQNQPSWTGGSFTFPLPSSWTPELPSMLSPAQHSSYTLPNQLRGSQPRQALFFLFL